MSAGSKAFGKAGGRHRIAPDEDHMDAHKDAFTSWLNCPVNFYGPFAL
jgi:hypothetical protein